MKAVIHWVAVVVLFGLILQPLAGGAFKPSVSYQPVEGHVFKKKDSDLSILRMFLCGVEVVCIMVTCN